MPPKAKMKRLRDITDEVRESLRRQLIRQPESPPTMTSSGLSPTPSLVPSESSQNRSPPPPPPLQPNNFLRGTPSNANTFHPNPPQNIGTEVESPNAATSPTDPPRSIRCKNDLMDSDPFAKKTRGVVTGKMMEEFFRSNKGLIKVEYSTLHKGPADKRIRSLLTHAIGSCVKAKVPMNAPSYLELEKKNLVIVYTYLSGHFDIPIDDTNLWEFILTTSIERFKAWKSACRKHWEEFGDEVPLEFTDRVADWTWLCNHFNDPANKALSEKMKRIRKAEKQMDHRSGKTTFSYRAEIHQKNGHVAPFVGSFDDAYGRDPVGKLYISGGNC